MRKLPLFWITVEIVVTLLALSGCVSGGRQSVESVSGSASSLAGSIRTGCQSRNAPDAQTRQTSRKSLSTIRSAVDDPQVTPAHVAIASLDPADTKLRIKPTAWIPGEGAEEGDTGVYVSGGSTTHNRPAAIGSTGIVKLPTPWSTVRYGVMGADDGGIGVGGVEAGVRVHAPTRFTPYAGLSTDLGFSGFHSGRRYRGNSTTPPQTVTKLAGLAAIVPEAGVSFWVTPSVRLNAGASYFIPYQQPDFLLFSLSMEFLLSDWSVSPTFNSPRRVSPRPPEDELDDPYFVDLKGLPDPMDILRQRVAERARNDNAPPTELPDAGSVTGESDSIPDDLPSLLVPQSRIFNLDSAPPLPSQKIDSL